jgi:hypothetical protein
VIHASHFAAMPGTGANNRALHLKIFNLKNMFLGIKNIYIRINKYRTRRQHPLCHCSIA